MDKQIALHKKFVQAEIARLAKLPDAAARQAAAQNLAQFHDFQTKNFQHERAIHLAVTLFFAVLMFGAWALAAAMWIIAAPALSQIAGGLLALLVTILEIFYLRYYYLLENRTQKLYALAREIYEMM